MKKTILVMLFISVLTSCGGGNGGPEFVFVDGVETSTRDLLRDEEKFRSFFSDTTIKNWDRYHGTQVEYHSADGQTWLVYPGNTRSVRGRWKARTKNGRVQMCYLYGPRSYNPVTRKYGGKWECSSGLYNLLSDTVVDGDVLKLRGRGAYPQPLPKKINISLNTIKKSVGLGELRAKNKKQPK